MNRAAKRDNTEPEIIDALTHAGYSVAQLSGKGIPDLIVGCPKTRRTHLLEVKSKGGTLTAAQRDFIRSWRGSPVWVVQSGDEALDVVARLADVVTREAAVNAWDEEWQREDLAR